MATSINNVRIPKNTWVDLYAATGITVGTKIQVQNVGNDECLLTESAVQPVDKEQTNICLPRDYLTNYSANVGAWAFSDSGTTLKVEIASGFVPASANELPQDFLLEVAKGNITGHSSLGFLTRKTAVGTSFEDLWGETGSMVYPTAPETWEIVSDNPNDTAGGTGARTAVITSLDENWLLRTDVVSLNGTTPVTIPGLHIRPQQVIITESGSSNWNEGTIRIRDQAVPANTRNYIRPEESISIDGHITVPADKNAYIAQTFTIFPKNVDGFSLVHIRDGGNPNSSWITATSIPIYQNQIPFEVKGFFPLGPKTDLNSRAKVTSGTGDVTIIYEFIFVDI